MAMDNAKMNKAGTMRKVLSYMKRYIPLLVISLALSVVTVALTLYFPILTGRAIDLIVGKEKVDFTAMTAILTRAAIIVVIAAATQWLTNICNNRMTYNIVRDIRHDAFLNIEKMPLSYIDSHSHGDMVSRIIADVDTFSEGLLMGFTQLFTGIATIAGTLIFMLTIDVKISCIVVLITPLSLFVASFITKKTYSMFQLQTRTRGEQTSLIDEIVGNEKVVQAFNHEDEALEQFDEINDRLQKCSLRATFFSSLTNPSTRFVNSLVYAGVGIFGAMSALTGGITVGQLSCFLSYANQYTKPFNEISGVITELQNALACAARIFELIEEEKEIPDASDAVTLGEADGCVDIEDVYFSYVPDKKLIEDFNLHVKPGQRVAIVGPTGCGKTTIINLLMRFYDVNSGTIKVSGHDIRKITRESLRDNYGMVLQETWLKKGTIRDNIIMGKPDATDEEIIAAAKASHAHSFIRRLPKGYDTEIGEDGGSLSQGQKQLLCITRVMLCLPPMLILDEATSSIDTRTEIKIQKAFLTMMQGRTSFIVAHRLSTIREADIILVMKDGKIIEQGNHESLLAADGFYANLYNSQFA
ncbi:ABC transporter ATP-binding protein [Agathobacter rectalis]|jgi:ATP-binding cassette subfamily B multidrug efflux pump|uniref:ABC transporter ATP-binding protein n=1 Tax=Agathobacter rectalis TaxID=39491 RepID=A0A413QTQ3_9FIRM|nr:ABC transporter ATP-binding protein [Agathobacter rectalis]RHA02811.1 ABC transporter ATP-binding protein [Agathobacter rectalis]RHA11394.1 ABC transporter ATP-binding protein [Agathobacter rectalis]